ncbi:MAG TPA: hypothetical protein VF637_05395 [Sphingomicrobium sp.]|jgi:hypothetical protein
MSQIRITELGYDDEELARFPLPGGELRITRGLGSAVRRRRAIGRERYRSLAHFRSP